jgi:predicted nucleic acid-binding protein
VTNAVIDASVAVKWYVPEVHDAAAARLLALRSTRPLAFHVPDLFFAEFGNILWKKVRAAELEARLAADVVSAMLGVPKAVHATEALLPSAVAIALDSGRTVYDSLYIALAAFLDCELVTADQRLIRGLANSPWAASLRWIEDV